MNNSLDWAIGINGAVDGIFPILRELRRELLLEISDGEKRIGDPDEITDWILEKYKQNPLMGGYMSCTSFNQGGSVAKGG